MNVGVIGSGLIVEEFVEESLKVKDYHLRGIWGRHEEKLKKFEEYFEYYTTDIEMLLKDPLIDLIYVALPNALHYEYAMMALKNGKNVLVEKPFTVYYKDAKKLIDYANKHNLICSEAIMTRYNPTFLQAKKLVSKLGEIKMVDTNFSQYSRRYDRFKKGEILPVFNKKLAGGALLDINVYNIHFVVMLFGKPKKVEYYPNMVKGVDTSGALILDYGTFKARCIACKDCKVDCYACVQGDEGYLRTNSTSSRWADYSLVLNNGKKIVKQGVDEEFAGFLSEMKGFAKLMKERKPEVIKEFNEETLMVAKIMDDALKSANIKY